MADRFPLIANSSSNQIQELAVSDNLNLDGNSIVGVVSITASGNISIGGTLTYEDVTNVDSVGIITARSGVRVLAGGVNIVGGGLTVTGQLEVENKTIGIASVSSPSDTTCDGAGLTIYSTTNKTLTWERDTGCFEYSEPNKFKGVIETISTGSTYDLGNGKVILELDVRNATSYTHNLSNGSVGIVSFKNMPADTGVSNGTTITVIFTQDATGTGNTTPTSGIGTNCVVIGFEDGSTVAGISTRALVGSGTTITLSEKPSDVDFVSFFVHYTGNTNTVASSYKVYATNNGGFRQGSVGV